MWDQEPLLDFYIKRENFLDIQKCNKKYKLDLSLGKHLLG